MEQMNGSDKKLKQVQDLGNNGNTVIVKSMDK